MRRTIRGWATAVSVVWRPVFSIPWPHWGCQAAAMVSATTTVCSSKTSSTAGRWSHRTTGWSTVTRGNSSAIKPAIPCALADVFNMRAKTHAGWKPKKLLPWPTIRLSRVMTPMPPTPCVCGVPRPAVKLISVNLTRGTISPPWRIRTTLRTFPACFTRTTRPIPGVNCACVRSISLFRRRYRTSSPVITSCIKPMTTWRIKLLSTSMTPIRCCRSRS
ncbi:Uncharacterised protein [Klebsiella pneumoniae]|nr:hypothetical protein SFB9_5939 [Klebsiella michiganensis]SCA39399.1 Uncharacterised protein [Klebsiella quasipneumoniae]SLX17187.1 Uncharacterised protein [Klebsiella pneumoniae]SVW98396.1 Uncharacterised protein [Klebsiella pneumoniae]